MPSAGRTTPLATLTRGAALALAFAVPMAGCGGDAIEGAATDRPPAPTARERSSEPAAAAAAVADGPAAGTASFDYTPEPAVPGFVRHEGRCDSYFRYSFQHPAEWEVESTSNGASRMRVDEEIFNLSVAGDLGEIQAARMNEAARTQGIETAGEITIGGRRIAVHRPEPHSYAFQIPHPVGGLVMYHQLQAWSTFPVEETLRILDTLEPIEGCE